MPYRERKRSSRLTRACEVLLALLAFGAPLALGSAPLWALWPFVGLSMASLVLALLSAGRRKVSLPLHPLAYLPLLAAGLCALQLFPLPAPLLRLLSPRAAELREFVLLPLGLTSWRPISLDPPGTWRELAKHLSYAALILSAAHVGRSRRARRRLASYLALSGLCVALIGFGHALVNANALFGWHAFRGAPPFVTSFGNSNHLAAFLTLSATLALGLALRAEERPRSLFFGGIYLLSGAALFLSLSRGGIAFFVAAQLALGLILLWSRSLERAERQPVPAWLRRGLFPVLALLGVVATASYIAYDRLAAELATADSMEELRTSKVQLWPMLASGANEFSRAGMGRGAFELAFARYQDRDPDTTFAYPENLLLQLWAELGLAGLLALLLAAAVGVRRLLRRELWTPVEWAAAVGLAAVLLHDLFDFSLELPATASAACLALGLLASREHKLAPLEVPPPRSSLAAALLALGVAVAALGLGSDSVQQREQQLSLLYQRAAPLGELRAAGLAAIDRHPADFLPHGVLGAAYSQADPRESLAFTNRSLYLRPLDVEAHRVAARALLRLGKRSQAWLEYRLAYEVSETSRDRVLRESVARAKGVEELCRLVPSRPPALGQLLSLLRALGRKEEARGVLERALVELSENPEVHLLWLELASQRLEAKELEEALDALSEAERRSADRVRATLMRAEILAAQGKRDQALLILEQAVTRAPGRLELWFALAAQQLYAGQPRKSRETLGKATAFITNSGGRASYFALEAEAFAAEGLLMRAVQSYQSACRLEPAPHLHYAVARLYERLSKPTEALEEVQQGARLEERPGAQAEWMARLRRAEVELETVRLRELEEQERRQADGQEP